MGLRKRDALPSLLLLVASVSTASGFEFSATMSWRSDCSDGWVQHFTRLGINGCYKVQDANNNKISALFAYQPSGAVILYTWAGSDKCEGSEFKRELSWEEYESMINQNCVKWVTDNGFWLYIKFGTALAQCSQPIEYGTCTYESDVEIEGPGDIYFGVAMAVVFVLASILLLGWTIKFKKMETETRRDGSWHSGDKE
mmetsp:Transcript_122274/g.317813  ORF Transcript_122274/g.317813 Transcript_122274/m.317813 type:complete len:198 (+) Transcript_122274:42-635(+)